MRQAKLIGRLIRGQIQTEMQDELYGFDDPAYSEAGSGGPEDFFNSDVRTNYEKTKVTDPDRTAETASVKIRASDFEEMHELDDHGLHDSSGMYDVSVNLHNSDRYDDIPTGSDSYYENFYPIDTRDTYSPGREEGEDRFEDLDGSEPLGREYETYYPEDLDYPSGSWDEQTDQGFEDDHALSVFAGDEDAADGADGVAIHPQSRQPSKRKKPTIEMTSEFGQNIQDLTSTGKEDSVMTPDFDEEDLIGRPA